ncbi:hypothetical protein [Solimicrobium silvestre]|uniref:Uncharacterized protein n=1 Tax=Solimicrobium silvestre TaxID=2099400 RepID=A0A2S9H590_9BURK|nr:hypothetical protein [Solimicrobium silvestre]PRC95036.1 hypothetical protein S2091_0231 [Solimicrobium silvestre]
MNTKRNKRWNGDVATLSAAYLKNVIEKMQAYGDNAQFSTNGTIHGPNYQVINTAGKKMSFDSGNLLIQTDEEEFTSKISATIYSLEQVKALLVRINSPLVKTTATRTRRVASSTSVGTTSSPRGGSALAKAKEQIAIQKYEYYKTNRATLPSDIREHSEEITRMMESGISAEEAFTEASKLCFDH